MIKNWLKAIAVVGTLVVVLYGAWLLAILTALVSLVFIIKNVIEISQE